MEKKTHSLRDPSKAFLSKHLTELPEERLFALHQALIPAPDTRKDFTGIVHPTQVEWANATMQDDPVGIKFLEENNTCDSLMKTIGFDKRLTRDTKDALEHFVEYADKEHSQSIENSHYQYLVGIHNKLSILTEKDFKAYYNNLSNFNEHRKKLIDILSDDEKIKEGEDVLFKDMDLSAAYSEREDELEKLWDYAQRSDLSSKDLKNIQLEKDITKQTAKADLALLEIRMCYHATEILVDAAAYDISIMSTLLEIQKWLVAGNGVDLLHGKHNKRLLALDDIDRYIISLLDTSEVEEDLQCQKLIKCLKKNAHNIKELYKSSKILMDAIINCKDTPTIDAENKERALKAKMVQAIERGGVLQKPVEESVPVEAKTQTSLPEYKPKKKKDKKIAPNAPSKREQREDAKRNKQLFNDLADAISAFNGSIRLDEKKLRETAEFRRALRYENANKNGKEYFTDAEANDICALIYFLNAMDSNSKNEASPNVDKKEKLNKKMQEYNILIEKIDDATSCGVATHKLRKLYDLLGCIDLMRHGKNHLDENQETWKHVLWAICDYFPVDMEVGANVVENIIYKVLDLEDNELHPVSELLYDVKVPDSTELIIEHSKSSATELESEFESQYNKFLQAVEEVGGINDVFSESDSNGQDGVPRSLYSKLFEGDVSSKLDERRCETLDILITSDIFDDCTMGEETERKDSKERWMWPIFNVDDEAILVLENVNYGNRTFIVNTARCGLDPKDIISSIKKSKSEFMQAAGGSAVARRHPNDDNFDSKKYADQILDDILSLTS